MCSCVFWSNKARSKTETVFVWRYALCQQWYQPVWNYLCHTEVVTATLAIFRIHVFKDIQSSGTVLLCYVETLLHCRIRSNPSVRSSLDHITRAVTGIIDFVWKVQRISASIFPQKQIGRLVWSNMKILVHYGNSVTWNILRTDYTRTRNKVCPGGCAVSYPVAHLALIS